MFFAVRKLVHETTLVVLLRGRYVGSLLKPSCLRQVLRMVNGPTKICGTKFITEISMYI